MVKQPRDDGSAGVRGGRAETATRGFVAADHPDVLVAARRERDLEVATRAREALAVAAPGLAADEIHVLAPVLHAVVDGLGVAVALGRITPAAAREVVRVHLEELGGRAR